MAKRVKPPEGQQCDCTEPPYEVHDFACDGEYEGHWGWDCCSYRSPQDHDWPDHGGELKRIYWQKDDHVCYGWWCANCRSWLPENEDGEGWPTGDDGRFMPSVHCQVIPGLD